MNQRVLVAASALLALTLAAPLPAQQNLGDLDGDGVPNLQDRCPNTPRGVRVDAHGCPITGAPGAQVPVPGATPARRDTVTPVAGLKGHRPPPTLMGTPGAAAPAVQPSAPAGGRPSPVTPQAAQPPTMAQPVAPAAGPASGFTAGLALAPFAGGAMPARLEYARRLAQMLDSTIVTLVGVFRNTSGQPLGGAVDTTSLSQRERDRWRRCRDLHWDLTTYAEAASGFGDSLPADAAIQRAAAALDTALTELQATAECDNVASMISAPGRWQPWGQQYTTSANSFYREWYAQIRTVHEKDRAFVIALNPLLPAGRRLAVPAGLQRNPPYAGAAPQ